MRIQECRLSGFHDRQDRFRSTPSLIGSPTVREVEKAMTAPKVVRTMCPMNCHPTFCGMLVEVEGGRLKTVSGDKENPDSQGFLCVRGRSTNEAVGPEAVGLWAGHSGFTPGSAVTVQMMYRFSNIYGCQNWHPAIIC